MRTVSESEGTVYTSRYYFYHGTPVRLRRFLQEGKVYLIAEVMPDCEDLRKPMRLSIIITSSCAAVTAAAL